MAHNLEIKDGKASFFTVKEPAWHNLGTIVKEAPTSEEAIKLAGLDFKVQKRKLYTSIGTRISTEESKNRRFAVRAGEHIFAAERVDNKFAIVREDNNKVFGIVGSKYEIVQNSQAFDFFDSIVGKGEAIFETAGALYNGEVIFITAKLPSHITVRGNDVIDKYLLLTMSHDGSSPIKAIFTPVRVVCANTLSSAVDGAKRRETYIFRHTKSVHDKLKQASEMMGITNLLADELTGIFDAMTRKKMEDDEVSAFLETSLGLVRDETGKLSTRAKNILENALEYYETGVGQEGEFVRGSLWGAYNAYTGYLQNSKTYKSDEDKMQDLVIDNSKSSKSFELALKLLKQ
jgi:phage/plasmid-like protein (TIGR03299 family)